MKVLSGSSKWRMGVAERLPRSLRIAEFFFYRIRVLADMSTRSKSFCKGWKTVYSLAKRRYSKVGEISWLLINRDKPIVMGLPTYFSYFTSVVG